VDGWIWQSLQIVLFVLLVPIVSIARLSTRTERASASPGQDPTARYTTSVVV